MHFNYHSSIIILVRKLVLSILIVAAVKATMVATLPLNRGSKNDIETFYEQITIFGTLISQNKECEMNIYAYNDSLIYVYLKQGKPITIIVSK